MNFEGYNIISHNDVVPADAPPRLIVFNHVAKTGGTTLSNILRDNLDDTFFNLENVADWIKVKAAIAELVDKKVLVEGHAWGAHEMFSPKRPVFYLTSLRDPLAVFRSNFSYAINHYKVLDGLEKYAKNYQPNQLTDSLGYGNLELAKARLEQEYAGFTVLDEFKDSVRLIADRLEFDVREFEVKNRSGSESLDLPESLKRKLTARMSDDLRLYEYGRNLISKRTAELAHLPGPGVLANAEVEEKRTETSFPDEYRRRSTGAIELIEKGAYREAIDELMSVEIKDFSVHLSLAECHDRLHEYETADQWYEQAYQVHPSFVFVNYVDSLMQWNLEKALDVVDRMLADIDSVIFEQCPDSQPFREKAEAVRKRMAVLAKLGREKELVSTYEQFLGEIEGRRMKYPAVQRFGELKMQISYILAGLLSNNGKVEEAASILTKVLKETSADKTSADKKSASLHRTRMMLALRNFRLGKEQGKLFMPAFILLAGEIMKAPLRSLALLSEILESRSQRAQVRRELAGGRS